MSLLLFLKLSLSSLLAKHTHFSFLFLLMESTFTKSLKYYPRSFVFLTDTLTIPIPTATALKSGPGSLWTFTKAF